MNWKECCDKCEPYKEKIRLAKKEIKKIEEAYIEEHRTFVKGDMVRIRTHKTTRYAVVVGNTLGNNGRCIPTLALIRKSRVGGSRFFRMHETDESIVIEKVEE